MSKHRVKKRKSCGTKYLGYLIVSRGPGRFDKDIFYVTKSGEKLYQASAGDLSEAKHVVRLLKGST